MHITRRVVSAPPTSAHTRSDRASAGAAQGQGRAPAGHAAAYDAKAGASNTTTRQGTKRAGGRAAQREDDLTTKKPKLSPSATTDLAHSAYWRGRHLAKGTLDQLRTRNGHSVNAYQKVTAKNLAKTSFPITDSYGGKLGTIKHSKTGWRIIGNDGALLSKFDDMQLQGYGAYVGSGGRKSHVMVGLLGGDKHMRAFIPKSALRGVSKLLESNRKHNGDASLDKFDAGMGSKYHQPGTTPIRRIPLGNPQVTDDAQYPVGGSYHRSDGRVGSSYGLYAVRNFGGGAPPVRPVSINTAGVRGGGVFNAIVSAGDTFDVYDETTAPDRNAVDQTKAPRWAYGQVIHEGKPSGIWGFVSIPPA